ncbi:hypothetical protein BH10PLA2_BH10PLA2_23150 [soil metagenome]
MTCIIAISSCGGDTYVNGYVRAALQTAYLFLLAYFGLTYFGQALLNWASLANLPLSPGRNPIAVGTFIGMLGAGNIFVIQGELSAGLGLGKHLSQMLPSIVLRYALFHGLIAIGCLIATILQLRSHALADRRPSVARAKGRFAPERMLRPGEQPVLWKEFCVDPGLSFNRVGRILVGLIVLGSFGPAVWNLGSVLWQYYLVESPQRAYPGQLTDMLGIAMNAWVRQVGIAVACLTILGVAVRAASSVSGEHEQETLDSLLASPLETVDILIAKWMGSLWSVRWGALWLCIVWSVGILLGGLNLIILPWLVVAWVVYAAFFASLGLWFSVRTTKTLTAMVWTLGATAVLSLGQALPWMLLGMPNRYYAEPATYWLALFQTYLMTPPVAFGWLSFRGLDFSFFTSSEDNAYQILQSIIAGLGVWLVAGLLLLRSANIRFKRSRVIPGRRPPYPPNIQLVEYEAVSINAKSGSDRKGKR